MRVWGLMLLGLLGLGCDDEEDIASEDVSTLDMRVSVDGVDTAEGASLSLRIYGPFGPIRLSGGDMLKLRMGGAPLAVHEAKDEYDDPIYAADVKSLSQNILMDIVREKDRSVRDFEIAVPPPIELEAEPLAGSAPLHLTWNAAPAAEHTLGLSVEGSCTSGIVRNLPNDVGSYEVFQAELMPLAGKPKTCPLTVTLERFLTVQRPLVAKVPYGFHEWIRVSRSVEVPWTE